MSIARSSRLRRAAEPLFRQVLHFYWRFSRGLTLGVRAVVLDREGHVLLIKHSYVGGWHLPGGGVEIGETLLDALRRELREEANVVLVGVPDLHGLFFNRRVSRRDHVAVYVVRDFNQDAAPVPDHEVIAHGFFPTDALPPDTTASARARLAEVLKGQPKVDEW